MLGTIDLHLSKCFTACGPTPIDVRPLREQIDIEAATEGVSHEMALVRPSPPPPDEWPPERLPHPARVASLVARLRLSIDRHYTVINAFLIPGNLLA